MEERTSYADRIHSKQFREVARTLAELQGPIQFLVHVKSPEMLAALAQRLHALTELSSPTKDVSYLLEDLMRDTTVFISVREGTGLSPFPQWTIPISAVNPSARCKVLYLPPFYFVYSPGLFETASLRHDRGGEEQPSPRSAQVLRFKV